MSKTFAELNGIQFDEFAAKRRQLIEAASDAKPTGRFPVNELAKALHPNRQYMKIEKITEMPDRTKCFHLVPDETKGTKACAVFQAGQYVSVYLDIDGAKVNRPYSFSSSSQDALNGFYEITVKYVEDGLASRYILDNWKEGDTVELSGPAGYFYYAPLRDAAKVIGVAGGSGITPFISMAKDIAAGRIDFDLTILYGSRREDLILYRKELEALAAACGKIKIVNVLSDEDKEGFEKGFINAELIKKYAPADEPYSVFLCGPQAMYNFVDKELEKLGLIRKYIRHELFGEVHDAKAQPDYPGCDSDTVKITVTIRDESRTVTGSVNDTIMQTLEKNGIAVPGKCRSGECGYCRSQLLSGKVYVPKAIDGRKLADFKFGGIHPCATFPLSDIEIEVPYAK